MALSSFKFNAVCVAVDIGLLTSEVLLTFPNPKFILASRAVVALVPPLVIGTTPVIFVAFCAENAKGTPVKS